MYLLIILLPLLGTIFSGIFGFKIGAFGAMRITNYCMFFTFLLSCIAFYEVALAGAPCYIEFFKWFDSELFSFSWGFMFDSLTVVMLIVVTSISMCVHLYSIEYMANDPHIQRFMAYLSLFTFFMLLLVTADNFFQLFLGWEGVGLCSYLLVNFWFGRLQANKAALKAMVVNRIGDIGLALGLFLIYYTFKTFDYSIIFATTPYLYKNYIEICGFNFQIINLICIFFFIAATGKSAQIGLHTWLPDAMEGPTPVSALIHAATMVTAGVFLIVRCSPLVEYASTASLIITISGAMTAFLAASIGLVQNDLKRVIAYSTCSQLGYMMIACGTSGYAVGMFHLTNHAFFKALLFLSAGSVIHALSDEQDMRKMGGLLHLLPFTYSMILIGSLSLMGFPFLTGFYSKDLILEWTFAQFSVNSLFAFWLGALSAFFTAFYSLRVICLTFLRKPSHAKINLLNVHEAPLKMAAPLLFLSFFSIFIGYFFKDMFVGLGTNFWGNSIFVLPQNILILEAEFLPTWIKLFPVFLSFSGAFCAFFFYNFFFKYLYLLKISFFGKFIYVFLNRKWFFDKIYNYILSQKFLIWGYRYAYQNVDRGFIEILGPTGIYNFIKNISYNFILFYNKKNILKTLIPNTFFNFYFTLFFIFFLSVIYLYFFLYNGLIFNESLKEIQNGYNLFFNELLFFIGYYYSVLEFFLITDLQIFLWFDNVVNFFNWWTEGHLDRKSDVEKIFLENNYFQGDLLTEIFGSKYNMTTSFCKHPCNFEDMCEQCVLQFTNFFTPFFIEVIPVLDILYDFGKQDLFNTGCNCYLFSIINEILDTFLDVWISYSIENGHDLNVNEFLFLYELIFKYLEIDMNVYFNTFCENCWQKFEDFFTPFFVEFLPVLDILYDLKKENLECTCYLFSMIDEILDDSFDIWIMYSIENKRDFNVYELLFLYELIFKYLEIDTDFYFNSVCEYCTLQCSEFFTSFFIEVIPVLDILYDLKKENLLFTTECNCYLFSIIDEILDNFLDVWISYSIENECAFNIDELLFLYELIFKYLEIDTDFYFNSVCEYCTLQFFEFFTPFFIGIMPLLDMMHNVILQNPFNTECTSCNCHLILVIDEMIYDLITFWITYSIENGHDFNINELLFFYELIFDYLEIDTNSYFYMFEKCVGEM